MRRITAASLLAASVLLVPAYAQGFRRGGYAYPLYPPVSTSPYALNPLGSSQSRVAPQADQNVRRGGFIANPAGARGGGVDDQLR